MTDREIIKELGGVSSVAKVIGVSQPAISYWVRKGIPELRRIQLKVVFPEKAHLLDVQTVQPTTTITSD
jgi:predicted transcriptional regulator